ncbi:MAG: B12-binding domain-containing radical SAM protein [Oscillospiraceae bacterium]|nr:B12-binding domain-containing radical SAM protein [Oscillospiraceae bacterium]
MKIVFIRLNMFEHISSDAMKPILFAIIRELTPQTHEIEFLDERAEPLPERIDADLIAFSVETYTAKRAYILAKRYKTPQNRIVMGGFHAAVMADEMLQYADTVLVGDAEGTWPQLLADCKNGCTKRKYISDETAEPLSPAPHPEIYRHRYAGIGVHQLSRGCKFNCDFCSIKTMYRCVRQKAPETVAAELRAAKEKIIFFADDNLFYNRESALAMLRAIAPLRKKWACQISMDAAHDDALLDEMKRAGCFLVLMGFESLTPDSLREMHKSANAASDYEAVIRNIYRHGLLIYGTFVLGYDGDTKDVFQNTLDFAVRNHITITNFNPLIPMPGTPVYQRMQEQGRLLFRKWWLSDKYRYGDTAYRPRNMSPDELREGCLYMRTEFYSLRCILRRLLGNPLHLKPVNLMIYLLANIISAKEIRAKQGQLLGGLLHEADAD